MIRFLVKSAIWLSLAFLIMPHFMADEAENVSSKPDIANSTPSTSDEIGKLIAGGKTAMEVGKFCMDNPTICENGQSALKTSAGQLLENSGALLGFLSDHFGHSDKMPTASIPETLPEKPQFIPVPTPRESIINNTADSNF